MFFWVFRFAKNTNFLLKGGIHFFYMRIFRVQFRFSQVPRLVKFLDRIYLVQTSAQSNAHAQLCYQGLCQPPQYLWYIHPRSHSIAPTTNVCVMSGDEEIVSKRARKNYPGEVSFGALSKEENEHSVAQVSRCTDTGNCTWTEDGTKPQLLGGLGEEGGGGSSLQQMVEEEFGELSFLLGEPQVRTVIIQYSTNGNNIR